MMPKPSPLSELDQGCTIQVMPFGLVNAPATFQKLMDVVLAGFMPLHAMVYIDDVVIFSRGSFEDLTKAPLLHYPDWNKEFRLETDASDNVRLCISVDA